MRSARAYFPKSSATMREPDATVSESGGVPALNVYQSETPGRSRATMATWYVDDLDRIVDELHAAGVELIRYDEFEHDAKGITAVFRATGCLEWPQCSVLSTLNRSGEEHHTVFQRLE